MSALYIFDEKKITLHKEYLWAIVRPQTCVLNISDSKTQSKKNCSNIYFFRSPHNNKVTHLYCNIRNVICALELPNFIIIFVFLLFLIE